MNKCVSRVLGGGGGGTGGGQVNGYERASDDVNSSLSITILEGEEEVEEEVL